MGLLDKMTSVDEVIELLKDDEEVHIVKNPKYEEMRKEFNLTLQDIADACGITRQAVQLFEAGLTRNSKCSDVYNPKDLWDIAYDKLEKRRRELELYLIGEGEDA